MMSLMLRKKGHHVDTAHNGAEALEVAARTLPEVIFLDIGMPVMDGYQACQRLREVPATRDAYIVALTGWGQEDDKRRAQEAGFDHHLVKPVDLNVLMSVLAEKPSDRSA
jgi:CheY-like chemotaxis protein